MFVIEARRKPRGWISGIFANRDDAEAFMANIRPDLRDGQTLLELDFESYPLYVIESDGFEYVSREEAIKRVRAQEPTGDEDAVYFNVYRVEEDYVPDKPGEDYMGILPHYHITDWALENLKSDDLPYFDQVFPK